MRERRTAADVIRGIRNNARLQLNYQQDGRLAVYVENSLLLQQPSKPAGSNATEPLNGGWPAYHYADGSAPGVPSAILRNQDDSPAFTMWSRPTVDTPNRLSIEFADQFNEYQQDSLAVVDIPDVTRTGQEITGRLVADGLPTFDQTARLLQFFLDKSIRGNRFIRFDTSVKALGQRVGDIIAVTYEKDGLLTQPFRIHRIEPGENYRSVSITAQLHDDAWYNGTNGQLTLVPPSRRLGDPLAQVPNTLAGDALDTHGDEGFTIVEVQSAASDGSILTELEVGFNPPASGASTVAGPPIINLQPTVLSTGGTHPGDQTLYYAVTALDAAGLEGSPSFVVRAEIPAGSPTFRVDLVGLSFTADTVAFNVYRGAIPSRLKRIAQDQPPAGTFSDTGLSESLDSSPDPQFDHANFYWRLEDLDEQFATISGPSSVGNDSLALAADSLTGHSVRLIRGKGSGQERTAINNTATTISVSPAWEIEPDISTIFTVADSTWRFGGRARSSPARFQVPNIEDKVVQVTGRAANAQNVESLEGLALVTRWRIGGGGVGVVDADPPPQPLFAVNAVGGWHISAGWNLLRDTREYANDLGRRLDAALLERARAGRRSDARCRRSRYRGVHHTGYGWARVCGRLRSDGGGDPRGYGCPQRRADLPGRSGRMRFNPLQPHRRRNDPSPVDPDGNSVVPSKLLRFAGACDLGPSCSVAGSAACLLQTSSHQHPGPKPGRRGKLHRPPWRGLAKPTGRPAHVSD